MIILSVDTSTSVAGVALCQDEKCIATTVLENGNTHSENLLPMIDGVLKMTKRTVKDVDLFVLSQGPGSFTGVRIAAATVKGLAFDTQKPCVAVSTLSGMAYRLGYRQGIICPCINARRNQVYTAFFSADGRGGVTRLTEDEIITVDVLQQRWMDLSKTQNGETLWLCGDGADLVKKIWAFDTPVLSPEECGVNAFGVALAGFEAYKKGLTVSDTALSPVYLKPTQAEQERLEKLKNQTEVQ